MKRRLFWMLSLILLTGVGLFYSCKKDTKEVDFHLSYFPLEKGTFVEYQVTHREVDANFDQTSVYKLKTVVGDTVIDNEGRVARKFYRYLFDELTQEYKIQDVWTAIIDNYRGELVEENQRKIKLVFAPSLSKEWDVNAFNSFDPIYAYYDEIHKPYTVNNLDFDSTVTVIEKDSTVTLIEYQHKYEVYAKGVGMIKKVSRDFKINNFNINEPVLGDEYIFEVLSFGVE